MEGDVFGKDDATVSRVQGHIDVMAAWVFCRDMKSTRFGSILLWPFLLAGSCLRKPEDRSIISHDFRSAPCKTWNSIRGTELLELMWNQGDFGPLGLYHTMERHGLNYCVA